MMIEPTIGRVVLYRPKDSEGEPDIRHAAQVAFVHSSSMVNLGCINEHGVHYNEQLVHLCQDDEVCKPGNAEWIPYQKAQAQEPAIETIAPAELDDDELQDRIEELQQEEEPDPEPGDDTKPEPGEDDAGEDDELQLEGTDHDIDLVNESK